MHIIVDDRAVVLSRVIVILLHTVDLNACQLVPISLPRRDRHICRIAVIQLCIRVDHLVIVLIDTLDLHAGDSVARGRDAIHDAKLVMRQLASNTIAFFVTVR